MVKRKINKAQIKRVIRPPSNAVVMSLMAIVLLVGAPALISVIDDSIQSEQKISLGSYAVEDEDREPFIKKMPDAPEDVDLSFSYIPGFDNNGTHVFTLNTLANKTYLSVVTMPKIDNSVFDAGVSRIVLNFSGSVPNEVLLKTTVPEGAYSHVRFVEILDADGVGTNSWVCDIDSYSLAKIKANDISPNISISFNGESSGVFEMTSETYKFTTIPYGEIIIGMTGGLLLICALFATPFFGVGGITKKNKNRRA